MILSIITLIWLLNSALSVKIPVTIEEVTSPAVKFNDILSMIDHPSDPRLLIVIDEYAIWEFNPETKTKTLIAGSTTSGYVEGFGENARFGTIHGSAKFNKTTIIITSYTNYCIRLVNTEARLTEHYAGVCQSAGFKDGDRLSAQFNRPWGTSRIGSDFYVCDYYNRKIRKISQNVVSTITSPSYYPRGLSSNNDKLIYTFLHGLGEFDLNSQSNNILTGGSSSGHTDGNLSSAQFYYPRDVITIAENIFVIADASNQAVRIVDLNKQFVSSVDISGYPINVLAYNGNIMVGMSGGRILKFNMSELPEMNSMERKVTLEAEYPIKCSTLNKISFSVIDSHLSQHTKYLKMFCPDCQVDESAPVSTCTNDTLISSWRTNIGGDRQVLSADIKSKLHTALVQFQSKYPVMDITIITTLPRTVSPIKDSTGLNIRVVIKTTCTDKEYSYNRKYDVCQRATN